MVKSSINIKIKVLYYKVYNLFEENDNKIPLTIKEIDCLLVMMQP